MTNNTQHDHNDSIIRRPRSRRDFLRVGGIAAAGVATPWAFPLNGIASAGAATVGNDYKALVCVFLYGGNDNYNTFVPSDNAGYNTYSGLRGNIAVARNQILGISPQGGFEGDGSIGFAPELSRMHGLFESGDVALVSNVGSMVAKLEKSTWDSNPALVPPSLGSHNDQQSFWQSGLPEGATSGWGGRLGDRLNPFNDASDRTYMCTSLTGNAVLLTGQSTQQFQVSPEGPSELDRSVFQEASSMTAGLNEMLAAEGRGVFGGAYADVSRRALESSAQLKAALARVESNPAYNFDRRFGVETGLAAQLRMVAKMIAAGRDELGMKRQVFFVGMGGFDTHSDLATDHPLLLNVVDDAMASFYQTTQDIGAQNNVTTFTGSDFGRTLSVNDSGSDHGWGSTHMVMGGAVEGNRVFGQIPTVALDGPNSTGRGRLLPTTSVDEYGATMARWMGADEGELGGIFPNLARHPQNQNSNLGFMG